jgi:hypothetical protein
MLPTRSDGAASAIGINDGSGADIPRWSGSRTTSKPICSARRASSVNWESGPTKDRPKRMGREVT